LSKILTFKLRLCYKPGKRYHREMKKNTKNLSENPSGTATLAATITKTDCANCGNALTGSYCSVCGQKKITEKDVTVHSFLENAFHEFTHIDSKILRSLHYLLFKPGLLTEEFIAGRRKRYMNPVQLFIVINLIYFILIGFFHWNTFTTPLELLLQNNPPGRLMSRMVDHKLAETGLSYEAYKEYFNHALHTQAKSLIIIMVPLFATLLSIMYMRQKRFFIEHLVFSVHFYGWVLIALGVALNIVFLLLTWLFSAVGLSTAILNSDIALSLCASLSVFVFLYLSLKRVYRETLFSTVIKAGISFFAFWIIIFLYRFILFMTVYYTLKLPAH